MEKWPYSKTLYNQRWWNNQSRSNIFRMRRFCGCSRRRKVSTYKHRPYHMVRMKYHDINTSIFKDKWLGDVFNHRRTLSWIPIPTKNHERASRGEGSTSAFGAEFKHTSTSGEEAEETKIWYRISTATGWSQSTSTVRICEKTPSGKNI